MLEECIDLKGAKHNEYVIKAGFEPALKELASELAQIKKKMESLKRSVQEDLGTTKRVDLVESNTQAWVFEVDKKEGDAGMRRSGNEYKVLSMKMRVMTFTCEELKELVRSYSTVQTEYQEKQDALTDKVLEIVCTYYPLLEQVSSLIA